MVGCLSPVVDAIGGGGVDKIIEALNGFKVQFCWFGTVLCQLYEWEQYTRLAGDHAIYELSNILMVGETMFMFDLVEFFIYQGFSLFIASVVGWVYFHW